MATAKFGTHVDYLAGAVFMPEAFEGNRWTSVTPEKYRDELLESANKGKEAFRKYILESCLDVMGDTHKAFRMASPEEIEYIRQRVEKMRPPKKKGMGRN